MISLYESIFHFHDRFRYHVGHGDKAESIRTDIDINDELLARTFSVAKEIYHEL